MQVKLTHHTPTRKSVELQVPAAEVTAEIDRVIARLAPKAKIRGFRPGKVPQDVLMQHYGREIHQEVAENLVKRHFWEAAAAAGTQPISQPALEKVNFHETREATFRMHFDVAPDVKVPDYKGLKVTRKKRRIDDETVTEHLEAARQRAAKFVPQEDVPAAEGHYATLDIKVKPQGRKAQSYKDQVLELTAARPFDKEILGMKVDETRRFTITMPKEEAARDLAGKTLTYEVVLKDLRARVVPELNDDFAKDMGEYENIQALRDFVRKELEEAADRDADTRVQAALLDMLLEAAPFEVPGSMVSLQLDDYCQEFSQTMAQRGVDPRRIDWAKYRQHRLHDAERAVRSGYLLQNIGNAEDIQVTDEEIDGDIRTYMADNRIQRPFETFKAELENRGATTEIKGRIRTDKIFQMILKHAEVVDEILDRAAFEELLELERKREAGLASARFDAGGLEGGSLPDQEGGEPDAIKPAESDAAPDAEVEADAEPKPKKPRAPRKPKAEAAAE